MVARLYYEQNMTQAEIAGQIGVSRPLISRMLDEARQMGIVEITVHTQGLAEGQVLQKAQDAYSLRGGYLVPDSADDIATNHSIGSAVLELIEELGGGHIGLGWGHIIGTLINILEEGEPEQTSITDVCPMVGNGIVSIRNYHSNENTRIMAQQTMSAPHYLYTPALADTREELDLLLESQQYKSVLQEWEKLDIALVNIGVHPSTPDFASGARYGSLLNHERAVGRMIAYYVNEAGKVIHSDHDYVIQIPLETLLKCENIVGICSANVNRKALTGALNTGFLTHIIARENLMREALSIY